MKDKLDDVRPATDLVILQILEAVADRMDHDHPTESQGPDLHCLNLTSWLGERMGPVLRRLFEEQAKVQQWKDRNRALDDEFVREAERWRSRLDSLDVYRERCFHAAELLDEALGRDEAGRTGETFLQDIRLLTQQRDEAHAELARLRTA